MRVETHRIWVNFPAVNEQRLYSKDTLPLTRVRFSQGDRISDQKGNTHTVDKVEETDEGLLLYHCGNAVIEEAELSDIADLSEPFDRLKKGQSDAHETFALRYQALQARARHRRSAYRGLAGSKVELIAHQLYIADEVSNRYHPRVLLADEVGLGKTIEACLILERMLSTGKAARVLILVPDSLVNQWFVELIRRFNRWFSIYDEQRCADLEKHDIEGNPFMDESLVICSIDYLVSAEVRVEQALEAGWDMVVVDEAHHLEWHPEQPSAKYAMIESIAARSKGLLLLTATPTQFGLDGHFARLRLLDPEKFSDYETFKTEAEGYKEVAALAAKIIDKKPLRKSDINLLYKQHQGKSDQLETLIGEHPGKATAELTRLLLDEYGTGRVIFRNTRNTIQGFPCRKLIPVDVTDDRFVNAFQKTRKELKSIHDESESDLRYTFREDPRLTWLLEFLREEPERKCLLICHSERKVLALKSAIESENLKFSVFHESMSLIQRDRSAAWFAEPDGAQLLICSEIGSEGRNFQFAHHLILFDLPLEPSLLEQRIGRLDRIGQTETIRIIVPYFRNTCQELLLRWYHEGLNAFEQSLKGVEFYEDKLLPQVLDKCLNSKPASFLNRCAKFEDLIQSSREFRIKTEKSLFEGRDRLLELSSFSAERAESIISEIQTIEADSLFQQLLMNLLEHYGVDVREYENGDIFLDSQHAFLEAFPSIPQTGALASFDRKRAVSREDIQFLTPDHRIFNDAVDVLLTSQIGTASFLLLESERSNLMMECIFVLETLAPAHLEVDEFLTSTPIRVLVDLKGSNRSRSISREHLSENAIDGDIHRFIETPACNDEILGALMGGAEQIAKGVAKKFQASGLEKCQTRLKSEHERLMRLKTRGHHIREVELETIDARNHQLSQAIAAARLRLDSLAIIMAAPKPALDPMAKVG
jgi:ATP-dependent helicase HepA